jgi:hypothetical protein
MLNDYYFIIVTLTYILLFNRMNRKLKQVVARASRASKSLFQGSSSRSNRRETMLRCVDGEEEEEQCGEEEKQQHVEEEQAGEQEWHREEERGEEEEEAELEDVPRQTRRSHMVAPPIAPARQEDRVLIRPLGDR